MGFMSFMGKVGDVITSPFTYDPPPNPYDSEGFTQRQAQRSKRQREEIARLQAGGVSERGEQVIREGREIAGQVRGAAKQTRGSLGGTAQEAADLLVKEGYATDPNYAAKLKKILADQGY